MYHYYVLLERFSRRQCPPPQKRFSKKGRSSQFLSEKNDGEQNLGVTFIDERKETISM